MTPTKCPCCDGYGSRARPAHLPGDGPLACVSCAGTGVLWRYDFAAPYAPQVTPTPWVAPLDPLTPMGPWWSPALPTVTWTVRPSTGVYPID